jgi:hypothetical protein
MDLLHVVLNKHGQKIKKSKAISKTKTSNSHAHIIQLS